MDEEIDYIEFVDGNAPIALIFKPDYLKSRDLFSRKINLTHWQAFCIQLLELQLEGNGSQSGLTFIRRRLVKYGLGVLERDYKYEIGLLDKQRRTLLSKYDKRLFQEMNRNYVRVGDSDGSIKTSIYMEEDDFGHIRKLSNILRITQESIMRFGIIYSVYTLNMFGDEIYNTAVDDLAELKSVINRQVSNSKHTDI